MGDIDVTSSSSEDDEDDSVMGMAAVPLTKERDRLREAISIDEMEDLRLRPRRLLIIIILCGSPH
jgi:hypothetical protein